MKDNLKLIEQREVLGKEFKIYGDFENPLFLAKDVAKWIEHSDVSMMLKSIDDEEKVTNIVCTLGGNQKMLFLTEDGLYEVLMQSRKPIAKAFKKEVKKILKSIRKNGGYIANQENLSDRELLAKALLVSQNIIEEKEKRNKELQEKNNILVIENEEMQPKAEYYDRLVNKDLLMNIRNTSKEIGYPEKKLVDFLLNNKILFRAYGYGDLLPYADTVKKGYFQIKEGISSRTNTTYYQTLTTVTGRRFIIKKLEKAGLIF